jgi:hypothetical protein
MLLTVTVSTSTRSDSPLSRLPSYELRFGFITSLFLWLALLIKSPRLVNLMRLLFADSFSCLADYPTCFRIESLTSV